MNKRRLLLLALSVGLCCNVVLLQAQTQAGSIRRVGVLAPSTHAKEEITLKPFFDQMRELGWIEGRNIAYDRVYAGDRHEILPKLAAELAARRPDLIYAPPGSAAEAAKRATPTIPIVFGAVIDPVRAGLVGSLARPGGNVTGVSTVAESLVSKRLELLREILPGVKRLGILTDPTDPNSRTDQAALSPLASGLGLAIVVADASNPVAFEAAVAKLVRERVNAIFTTQSAMTFNLRARLIEIANRARVPVMGHRAQMADDGALFSYSASLADQLRRSADMVDKVLRGAKPGEIPVEQPTKFEFVVNMKTAKALGIKIPQSIMLRADRVIE